MNHRLDSILAQESKRFPLLNSFKGEQPSSHMTHLIDLICMPKISLFSYGSHLKVHSREIIQTWSKKRKNLTAPNTRLGDKISQRDWV